MQPSEAKYDHGSSAKCRPLFNNSRLASFQAAKGMPRSTYVMNALLATAIHRARITAKAPRSSLLRRDVSHHTQEQPLVGHQTAEDRL